VTQPDDSQDRHQQDQTSHEDRQFNTAEMMVGTAMMFVGFLNVLLSISGGFEMAGVVPVLLYFAGMAIWAHATIVNPSVKYTVMIVAITAALAFLSYGEVLFWHKQVIFWGTILMVGFFMFKTAAPTPKA
jgi:VIT1/CCC1 family predicted Fe2+/Mn2+ transporter